jgi:hypothetical protein
MQGRQACADHEVASSGLLEDCNQMQGRIQRHDQPPHRPFSSLAMTVRSSSAASPDPFSPSGDIMSARADIDTLYEIGTLADCLFQFRILSMVSLRVTIFISDLLHYLGHAHFIRCVLVNFSH